MSSPTSRLGALALLTALAACSEDPSEVALVPIVADSAGITLREYPHTDADIAPWSVDPTPVLQIGALEGSGPDIFGTITTVKLDADGSVAVADEQAGEVRRFGATGEFRGALGGLGEGPGEFASSVYILRVGGDSVVAWDGRQQRVSVFVGDTFVESWSPSGELILSRTVLAGDRLFGEATARLEGMPETGMSRPGSRVVSVRAGDSPETLIELPGHERYLDIQMAGGRIAGIDVFQTPFARGPFFGVALGDDGPRIVGGENDRLVLKEWDAAGGLVAIHRFPQMDHPITDEELTAARETVAARYDEPGPRMQLEMDAVESSAPDFMPAFDRVWPDDAGRLWVRRSANREGAEEWLVLRIDSGLEPVGRIRLPDGFNLSDVREGLLAGSWRDEFEVPHVRVYRLLEE